MRKTLHFLLSIIAISHVRSEKPTETVARHALEKKCNSWPFETSRGAFSGLNSEVAVNGYNKLVSPPPEDGRTVVINTKDLSFEEKGDSLNIFRLRSGQRSYSQRRQS